MAQGEVGGLRTVECLRGRLLAERLASTAAREEAELMNKRLVELERRLAEEIEARNKAEKRLKRVLKKLESLEIFDVSCSLSNVSDDSESSSSACFSVLPLLEEGGKSIAINLASEPCEGEGKPKRMLQISSSEDIEGEISGALSLESVNQSVSSLEESWGSTKTDQLPQQQSRVSLLVNAAPSAPACFRFSELIRGRITEVEESKRARDQTEDVDGRSAIVPARMWPDAEMRIAAANRELS